MSSAPSRCSSAPPSLASSSTPRTIPRQQASSNAAKMQIKSLLNPSEDGPTTAATPNASERESQPAASTPDHAPYATSHVGSPFGNPPKSNGRRVNDLPGALDTRRLIRFPPPEYYLGRSGTSTSPQPSSSPPPEPQVKRTKGPAKTPRSNDVTTPETATSTHAAPSHVIPSNTTTASFVPFEIHDAVPGYTDAQTRDLTRQHKMLSVRPINGDEKDPIADSTREIPYSSEKKDFGGKTGKTGFSVYAYSFRSPKDGVVYEVMWDKNDGFTRVTPFFKACGYSKTTPAKAIDTTPGLRALSHSITGGALPAQGYWMPFECARALCLTFCYDIRHALTPIFGPGFVQDCLPKSHDGYGKFQIAANIINAASTAPASSTAAAPPPPTTAPRKKSPSRRPTTPPSAAAAPGPRRQPSRAARPTFAPANPFESEVEDSRGSDEEVAASSPSLSPKSTPAGSGWTPINPGGGPVALHRRRGSGMLAPPSGSSPKRDRSESDDEGDLIPAPSQKRARPAEPQRSVRLTAEDFRAAQILVALSEADAALAEGGDE